MRILHFHCYVIFFILPLKNRFDFSKMFGGKISKEVRFPEDLNIRPYMSNNKVSGSVSVLNVKIFNLLHCYGLYILGVIFF